MKFEKGDRVKVYGNTREGDILINPVNTGTIVEVGSMWVHVDVDGFFGNPHQFHPKQFRKFKKKKPKRVLTVRRLKDSVYFDSNISEIVASLSPGEYIEFIEVRKKND